MNLLLAEVQYLPTTGANAKKRIRFGIGLLVGCLTGCRLELVLLAAVDVLVDPNVPNIDRQQLSDFGIEEAAPYADFIDLHREATLANVHIPKRER